jgi:hypothetical protein
VSTGIWWCRPAGLNKHWPRQRIKNQVNFVASSILKRLNCWIIFFCRLVSNVSFWAISVQPKPIFGLGQGLKLKLINYWKMTVKIIIYLSWNDPLFFLIVYQKKVAIEFQTDWENVRNYNNRQWNHVHIRLVLRCVLLKKSAIF